MRFAGKLVRDGRWWLAEIPMLDALTQGRTRREALEMAKDWLETAVNRGDFHATVHEKGRAEFEVSGPDATSMVALLPAAPRSERRLAERDGIAARSDITKCVRALRAGRSRTDPRKTGRIAEGDLARRGLRHSRDAITATRGAWTVTWRTGALSCPSGIRS
jgi:hypothetical protein